MKPCNVQLRGYRLKPLSSQHYPFTKIWCLYHVDIISGPRIKQLLLWLCNNSKTMKPFLLYLIQLLKEYVVVCVQLGWRVHLQMMRCSVLPIHLLCATNIPPSLQRYTMNALIYRARPSSLLVSICARVWTQVKRVWCSSIDYVCLGFYIETTGPQPTETYMYMYNQ